MYDNACDHDEAPPRSWVCVWRQPAYWIEPHQSILNHYLELLGNMHGQPQCLLDSPTGIPTVQQGHMLPDDVAQFYQLCGGLTLVEGEFCLARIVSPHEVVQTWVGIYDCPAEQLDELRDGPSFSWYVIGNGDSGAYISIDLNPSRLGFCCYSFWDSHAMKGYSPVIAASFSDLLSQMWARRGKSFYRDDPKFKSLGDFYDFFDLGWPKY